MKLQPASRKEVLRITAGTAVCDVIMIAALFVLALFDIGTFDLLKILLSALAGSVIAVLNFINGLLGTFYSCSTGKRLLSHRHILLI